MPDDDARFPKAHRILRKPQFDRVFDAGRSTRVGPLVVYLCTNELGIPRLGLVVSRKLGSAVVRNRWKRRLREAFRLEKHNLIQNADWVIIPRGRQPVSVEELRRALRCGSERMRGNLQVHPGNRPHE